MNAIRSAAAAVLLLAASACTARAPTEPAMPILTVVDGPAAAARFDPAQIRDAHVEGDRLHVAVTHGGGCEQHDFALYFAGHFRESDPVVANLRLGHDAKGDPCRAVVGRDLVFDLTSLAQAWRQEYGRANGTILIALSAPTAAEPHPEQLRYEF